MGIADSSKAAQSTKQLRRTVSAARCVGPKELPLRRLRARRPCGRYLLLARRELQSQHSEPAHLSDLRARAGTRQDRHDPDAGWIYDFKHRHVG